MGQRWVEESGRVCCSGWKIKDQFENIECAGCDGCLPGGCCEERRYVIEHDDKLKLICLAVNGKPVTAHIYE